MFQIFLDRTTRVTFEMNENEISFKRIVAKLWVLGQIFGSILQEAWIA